jgi:hypothetical protein
VPRTTIPWLPVAALAPDRFPAVEHLAISDVLITVIYDNRDSGAPEMLSARVADNAPKSPGNRLVSDRQSAHVPRKVRPSAVRAAGSSRREPGGARDAGTGADDASVQRGVKRSATELESGARRWVAARGRGWRPSSRGEGVGGAMALMATFEAASSRFTLRQVPHHRSQRRSQLVGPRPRVLSHIPHHLENAECLAPAQGTRDRQD